MRKCNRDQFLLQGCDVFTDIYVHILTQHSRYCDNVQTIDAVKHINNHS